MAAVYTVVEVKEDRWSHPVGVVDSYLSSYSEMISEICKKQNRNSGRYIVVTTNDGTVTEVSAVYTLKPPPIAKAEVVRGLH